MKREKVQFRTVAHTPPDSGEHVYDEVWGYQLSDFFGGSRDENERWVITHIPSSLLLFDVRFATLDLCSRVVDVTQILCPSVPWKDRYPGNEKLTSRFWGVRDAIYDLYKSHPAISEMVLLKACMPLLETHRRGAKALIGDSRGS